MTSTGQLQVDIDFVRRAFGSELPGQIRIVNAGFTQAGVPLGLRNGNGVLTLTRDRLDITQFQGNVGGGTVAPEAELSTVPICILTWPLRADEVRVLYDQSIRTTLSFEPCANRTVR